MRPAERIAASVLSYTGGGVQPANKGKEDMFGDKAPIWQFKEYLGAEDNPELARNADSGLFLMSYNRNWCMEVDKRRRIGLI